MLQYMFSRGWNKNGQRIVSTSPSIKKNKYTLYKLHLSRNIKQIKYRQVKWSYYIEQWGNIEQSYFFHGNSPISFYNSYVTSMFVF